MRKKRPAYDDIPNRVNWDDRIEVIAVAMNIEKMISVFLADLTRVPEKLMKGIASRTKVEFLIGIGALKPVSDDREKVGLFFEIRNQCVHNQDWQTYGDFLNEEQVRKLRKWYPSKLSKNKDEQFYRAAIKKLCFQVYQIIASVIKVKTDQAARALEDLKLMTTFVGLSSGLREETDKLAKELEHLISTGKTIDKNEIARIPYILKARINQRVNDFVQQQENKLVQQFNVGLAEIEMAYQPEKSKKSRLVKWTQSKRQRRK